MTDLIAQIGALFYPLLFLSLLGLTLTIERTFYFIKQKSVLHSPEYKAASAELENNAHLPKVVRDELLSFRLMEMQQLYERGLKLLRLVAVIAPMVGLLGTVIGMIEAFRVISATTGPVSPAAIADGLWSAMLTTAYGLIIAVPCLFCAFLFARISEKRLGALQHCLNARSLEMEGAVMGSSTT